jgi:sigma-B regulation protein RsbU (phosphoserine phosphatase)
VGICVYDNEARPLFNNDLFNRIVGGAPASGQPQSPLGPLLARAREGEAVIAAEVDLPAEVSPLHAHVSVIPVRDDGKLVGIIAVVVDSSPEAGQRETMGIVGHDLRNPLAAIRMTAQLLGKPDEMTPDRRMVLSKRILTSSIRMDAIVKSLLDYARARAGALVRLEREPVDLAVLATRGVEEQTTNVTGRSIEVRRVGGLDGEWDPARVEQIIGQLTSNALRHGTDGVSLLTLDGSMPDRVQIQLRNEGPPIPESALPYIFDPFRIGPRPPGTPRRSIGLGLFVVKALAEAHGGSVSVESSAATGTQFTVSLPRKPVTTA